MDIPKELLDIIYKYLHQLNFSETLTIINIYKSSKMFRDFQIYNKSCFYSIPVLTLWANHCRKQYNYN